MIIFVPAVGSPEYSGFGTPHKRGRLRGKKLIEFVINIKDRLRQGFGGRTSFAEATEVKAGCGAVGSVLRSGRRGRKFESSHPDK